MALDKFIPGLKKIRSQDCYDDDMGMHYKATSWDLNGHRIDVNLNDNGYCRGRVDGGDATPSMDEGGLLAWLQNIAATFFDRQ